jgi:hypothetical protein
MEINKTYESIALYDYILSAIRIILTIILAVYNIIVTT